MAKGLEKHKERLDNVALLGKDLARRAKSKCELCEGREGKLTPYEVEPLPEIPNIEEAILLCGKCRDDIEKNKFDQNRWRFLESIVWSELPPIQVTALRVCKNLNSKGVGWAQDLLDNVYISPEVEEWLARIFHE